LGLIASRPFTRREDSDAKLNGAESLNLLLDRMALADQAGLDVFGIGEHHRSEFLNSAPVIILAAAAARTTRIHLTSAVTVLSAVDPVRAFQNLYGSIRSSGNCDFDHS
jgi:alkanesulfonate monooxygenase SsuD/methylene tetrahydromethanopterin reductase-like flavin-dependent oxidoreductase (luciferase family)